VIAPGRYVATLGVTADESDIGQCHEVDGDLAIVGWESGAATHVPVDTLQEIGEETWRELRELSDHMSQHRAIGELLTDA